MKPRYFLSCCLQPGSGSVLAGLLPEIVPLVKSQTKDKYAVSKLLPEPNPELFMPHASVDLKVLVSFEDCVKWDYNTITVIIFDILPYSMLISYIKLWEHVLGQYATFEKEICAGSIPE